MPPGDREIILASEEATRRNVQTAIEFGNETRRLVRDLEEKMNGLQRMIVARDSEIALLRQQLLAIQARLFGGGSSDD